MLDIAQRVCSNIRNLIFKQIATMKSYTIFQKSDDETVNEFLTWMRNQERGVYRAALRELSALKKLRPQFMQQKPVEEQFAWLRKMLCWMPAETISDHLLQVWLIRKHEHMLVAFIEKLGIQHNGHGVVDELPEKLDPEQLKVAVDELFANNPAGAASVYLHMFQNQTEEGWPELQDILDNDPRVTLK